MNRVSATFAPPYHIPVDALTSDPALPLLLAGRSVPAIPPRPLPSARGGDARAKDRKMLARGAGGKFRHFRLPVVLACGIAGSMLGLAERERVVLHIPALGAAYAAIGLPTNPIGLAIEDVHARMGEIGARKVLLVDGAIVNLRARDSETRSLRIVLRDSDGRELYEWTTRAPKASLAKAERDPFAARLEAPPDGVKDAVVNFVDRAETPPRGAEGS